MTRVLVPGTNDPNSPGTGIYVWTDRIEAGLVKFTLGSQWAGNWERLDDCRNDPYLAAMLAEAGI